MAMPTVASIDPKRREVDSWRVLPVGLERLLVRGCPAGVIEMSSFGNVLTATALMMGIATEELRSGELDSNDPDHPVVACGRVKKAADQ